ncbi:hypothetical protein ANCDUO_01825 [Ancylostoma duodenale]|uniref:Uncharacterized protein n=1 Tax=Ancylostoma duodenale TaxID=51022 RepID=A0A0C2HE72_9BILA|nr:hypothetical protein ANCDUO_01825 [Ancylostoma duodenale]
MSQARRSNRRKEVVNELSEPGSAKRIGVDSSSGGSTSPTDYLKLSASEVRNAILERNKDPMIGAMVLALISKT